MQLVAHAPGMPAPHGVLDFLTGPAAAGRLSGTAGARRTASFLAGELRALGLEPAAGSDFFAGVLVPATRLDGEVTATVLWRNGERLELRHRVDFAEHVPTSSSGAFRAELAAGGGLRGRALWVPDPAPDFDGIATARAAREAGAAALVVGEQARKWMAKSVHPGEPILPVLRLSTAIALQAGDRIEAELPLERRALVCHNVIGAFRSHARAAGDVYVTAHYDHVGDDPGGLRFPGAVDNASGVLVALAVARWCATLRGALPFHLHFAFLTGEESGLHGARALIASWRKPPLAVLNVDGVGLGSWPPRFRIGQALPGDWLGRLASSAIRRAGGEPAWVPGRDDSHAFARAGVPVIGLGQQGRTPMHTPDDGPGLLRPEPVAMAAQVVIELIGELASHAKERA